MRWECTVWISTHFASCSNFTTFACDLNPFPWHCLYLLACSFRSNHNHVGYQHSSASLSCSFVNQLQFTIIQVLTESASRATAMTSMQEDMFVYFRFTGDDVFACYENSWTKNIQAGNIVLKLFSVKRCEGRLTIGLKKSALSHLGASLTYEVQQCRMNLLYVHLSASETPGLR